jgi:multidrug resistance efflux pump
VRRRRGLIRPLLLFGVPLIVGLVGLDWYAVSGRYVTTENAYVKSDIVAISSDVDGRVVSVEVAENQLVARGDVLFRRSQRAAVRDQSVLSSQEPLNQLGREAAQRE